MKKATKYLSQYSTSPKEVDRLITSAFLEINNLQPKENKLLRQYTISKSNKDEYLPLLAFIEIIKSETSTFDFEELIKLFEFVISPADRIITGAIYTPKRIRDYIIEETFNRTQTPANQLKVADIACGCGGFLFSTAIELKKRTNKSYLEIFKQNIFGIDIQKYSIDRTKLLLSLLALKSGEDIEKFEFNLFVGDSLDFKWADKTSSFKGFDAILGNPPYVSDRYLSKETKEKLKAFEVCQIGNLDLYIPFFQIGIENLSENGILGYITMNSFFKSLNGRSLRDYFQRKELSFDIIDFGAEQIFHSRSTYTCICLIENRNRKYIQYASRNSKKLKANLKFDKIKYNKLDSIKGWNLKNHDIISKIESTGTPFGELYQTRHGIATLKNDIYIFKPIDEDDKYYYLQNGSTYPIEKEICRDIVNSNKLSRKSSIKKLREKVIFPYDNSDKPKLLDENLIKEQYPKAYFYLQNKREILSQRDKGNGDYENWFAFGRTQSLEKVKNKMFFPKYSDITPDFLISSDENLLFYNGLAIIESSKDEMKILKKILESSVFWYYIESTSKPYSSNYYSLNGTYIKNFGICDLSPEEKDFLLKETNQENLDDFFEKKYKLKIK